jgi:glycosyltransferase involved in cell wall biosynthesis
LHNDVEIIGKIYKNNRVSIVNLVDIWGFRSNEIKSRFERLFGIPDKSFLCYSGIPTNLIDPPARTFDEGVKKFLFVGLLIPRKFPSVIVQSINEVFKRNNFHITFIGRGPEKETIQKLARNLNIAMNISFKERMSRDEVFKVMQLSDCFIMISRPETFGLVYLEAMSMGCITIGSKKEGIDGIIQHGINGFLCNAGDPLELSALLKEIKGLSKEDLITLSTNAIKTATDLTDKKVAKRYIESVY